MGEKEKKKKKKVKSYMLPKGFRNFSVNYERSGVNLSKWGMQIKIFKILNLGLLEYFGSRVASRGSNAARLGELGDNLLPLFPINRRKGKDPRSA